VLPDSTIRCAEPSQASKFVTLFILIPCKSELYFMYHQFWRLKFPWSAHTVHCTNIGTVIISLKL